MKQIDFTKSYIQRLGSLTPSELDQKILMDNGKPISHQSLDRHCRTLRKQGILGTTYNRNGTVTFWNLLSNEPEKIEVQSTPEEPNEPRIENMSVIHPLQLSLI